MDRDSQILMEGWGQGQSDVTSDRIQKVVRGTVATDSGPRAQSLGDDQARARPRQGQGMAAGR